MPLEWVTLRMPSEIDTTHPPSFGHAGTKQERLIEPFLSVSAETMGCDRDAVGISHVTPDYVELQV